MKRYGLGSVISFVVIALSVLWIALAACGPASELQRSGIVHGCRVPMLDWNFTRLPAGMEHPYDGEGVRENFPGSGSIERADICNPPLVMACVRLLPEGKTAGWIFSSVGLLLYLASAAYFLRRRGGSAAVCEIAALALAFPMIFAVYVGNAVTYAAAAALIFLSDYDSESRPRRIIAALMLALAFAVKISPALLGVLYFGRGFRRRFSDAALAAVTGALLLLVPFCLYGGLDAFPQWLENAGGNSLKYAWRNPFGVYGMFVALGRYPWSARCATIVIATFCLLLQFRLGGLYRIALAVVGMLLLPPTMMIYTLAYLLPVMLLICRSEHRMTAVLAAVAFVMMAFPLQLHLGCVSAHLLIMATGSVLAAVAAIVGGCRARNVV